MIKFFWIPREVWCYVVIPIFGILIFYLIFNLFYSRKKGTYYYNYVVDFVYSTLGIIFCGLLFCLLLGYSLATLQILSTNNLIRVYFLLAFILVILPIIPFGFLIYVISVFYKNLKRKAILDIELRNEINGNYVKSNNNINNSINSNDTSDKENFKEEMPKEYDSSNDVKTNTNDDININESSDTHNNIDTDIIENNDDLNINNKEHEQAGITEKDYLSVIGIETHNNQIINHDNNQNLQQDKSLQLDECEPKLKSDYKEKFDDTLIRKNNYQNNNQHNKKNKYYYKNHYNKYNGKYYYHKNNNKKEIEKNINN